MQTWKQKHAELLGYYQKSRAAVEARDKALYLALTSQTQILGSTRGEYSGTLGTACRFPDGKIAVVWDHYDLSRRDGDIMLFDSLANALALYNTLQSPHNQRMAAILRQHVERSEAALLKEEPGDSYNSRQVAS